MGDFNFNIPDELHKLFKMVCIAKETDMTDKLNELIKNFVEESKDDLIIKDKGG